MTFKRFEFGEGSSIDLFNVAIMKKPKKKSKCGLFE